MGKIIAVANQKGGVGKTTTQVNLSACVAAAGRRVLSVDMDPQANATSGLGLLAEEGKSLYDVLVRGVDVDTIGQVIDLRKVAVAEPALFDANDYGQAQTLGRRLRAEGAKGLVYPSVRRPKGQCLAAFKPRLLSNCAHSAYLEYRWTGERIDAVFQVSRLA